MAHMTMGDAKELWSQAPHDWQGLHQAIEQRQGKAEGISNTVIDQLAKLTANKQSSGQSFPSSPEQMYEMFNSEMGGGPDR
ncbi:MAG: hypothetical protein ACRDFS_03445 [Chloroflexota bacterium]